MAAFRDTSVLASILVLCAWLPAPVPAAVPEVDTRVLIDISGSMKRTDPQNLRAPALRLLTGLLPAGSRAGVWTFGRYASMEVAHGVVDEQWRTRARAGAARIHSRGLFTNIETALDRATRTWQGEPGAERRNLILLTDGMVDVSKEPGASEASRARIFEALLPALVSRQVRVLAIALSAEADHELLQALAQASGGWYEAVESADDLQRAFLRVFEKAARPDTLPLQNNRFQVDESIAELTLLVFRDPQAAETRLQPPGAEAFTEATAPANVSWRRDQGYDLVTIGAPATGTWRIEAQLDPDNRVLVVTDLRLESSPLPNFLTPGDRRKVHAFVSDRGEHIQRAGFTRLLQVFVEHEYPDGTARAQRLEADAEHIFSADLEGLDVEGEHRVSISAVTDTFARERSHSFKVAAPVVIEVGPPADGYPVSITPRSEIVAVDSLQLRARLVASDGESRDLALARRGETWHASAGELQTSHLLVVSASGRGPGGGLVAYDAPAIALGPKPAPAPTPPPAAPGHDWLTVAWQVAAVNLALVALGALGWWWHRRRARADDLRLAGVES